MCILCMKKSPTWYSLPAIHIWQQTICCTFHFYFVVLYGYGEKKRIYGVESYLIFWAADFNYYISSHSRANNLVWNIKFYGLCNLLTLPLEKLLKKIPAIYGMAICFLLFLLCKQIQFGQIGITGLLQIQVPNLLY